MIIKYEMLIIYDIVYDIGQDIVIYYIYMQLEIGNFFVIINFVYMVVEIIGFFKILEG